MSLRMSSLVLVLLATLSFVRPASAGSLSVLYNFVPNSGGDNAAGYVVGPGISIGTGGDTGCSFCFPGTFFNPGTTLNASISSLDFGSYFTGVFQGTVIDPNNPLNFSIGSTTLTAGSFTFPSFDKDGTFTITVPASIGIIHIRNGSQTQAFEVKPGQLTLTFDFSSSPYASPFGPAYYFSNGRYTSAVVTPEPGALVLLGSGLLGIAFRKFRERGCQRA